jgi:hypothetical protein
MRHLLDPYRVVGPQATTETGVRDYKPTPASIAAHSVTIDVGSRAAPKETQSAVS